MSQAQHAEAEIVDLTIETFERQVLQDASPILIDFWAPWCGPCRTMTPILHEAAGLLEGVARIGKVNVDMEPLLSDAFGIRGIPTLVLMRGGKAVDAISGVMPAEALAARVREKLAAE